MTHLLSEITIRNFKSIKNETFDLSAFTPLVGYNNAGKSNMLEGIKWLLRKTCLIESSFNDKTQAIEIEGKISGISTSILAQLPENQRTSIQPFLFADSLFIKRVQSLPAQELAIQTNLISLKAKMQAAGIYVWTKGTIENHLGGIQKNEIGWANFNSRLETDDLCVILPNDHTEISNLVTWLLS